MKAAGPVTLAAPLTVTTLRYVLIRGVIACENDSRNLTKNWMGKDGVRFFVPFCYTFLVVVNYGVILFLSEKHDIE